MSKGSRRGLLVVGAIVGVVVIGTVGFMLIQRWSLLDSLYMTVITIFTVGFNEVHPLSRAGHVFTILLIMGGVGTILYGIGAMFEFVVSGQLTGAYRRRAVRKQVEKLHGHYIICGYGRVGESVASQFGVHGATFVVVDNDPVAIARADDAGHMSVHGDAADDDVLHAAGIGEAKGLVTAVGSEAGNIFVTLSARVLNPSLLIVARAVSDETASKLERAGADHVVSPYGIGGKRMATLMMKPLVSDYLEVVSGVSEIEFRLEEFALNHTCEVVGRSIGALDIRRATGATVLAVRRGSTGGFDTNPSPDLVLEQDDVLIAIGTPPDIKKLEELFACRIPVNAPGATGARG